MAEVQTEKKSVEFKKKTLDEREKALSGERATLEARKKNLADERKKARDDNKTFAIEAKRLGDERKVFEEHKKTHDAEATAEKLRMLEACSVADAAKIDELEKTLSGLRTALQMMSMTKEDKLVMSLSQPFKRKKVGA